jgi:deoxyribonuclease V
MQNELFPTSVSEAIQIQKELAQKVMTEDCFSSPLCIAGVDVSNTPFDPKQRIYASFVVLAFPALSILENVERASCQTFPYITGLLGFREVPALVQLYKELKQKPDLLFVDGHGISHPRGLGIASHLGVSLDIPTIGVAKSILVGKPAGPLPEEPGSLVPLLWKKRTIGMLLRSKKRCRPLIISTGHRVSLESACSLVMQCLRGYRLPEPTRHAHLAANLCRTSTENLQTS